MNKKKVYFLILTSLFFLLLIGYVVIIKYKLFVKENKIENNQNDKDNKVNSYNQYLANGIKFLGKGDAGDKNSYNLAIDEFQKAADISDNKVWLPYYNLGNTFRKIFDFNKAEVAYDQAIKISGQSEGTLYIAKIEMFRYELKKSDSEIRNIYKEAIENVYDNANLLVSYAAYLRDIGDYPEAIKYYELLLKKYPNNQLYISEIKDLKSKIK